MIRKGAIYAFLGGLLVFNVLAWGAIYDSFWPQTLEVNFFDVGQGDSVFIETPKHEQILIDGGPGAVVLEKLAKEMPFWDRTIDLIILSHPEKDHLAGLLDVLKRYKVKNILWTGVVRQTAEYKEWVKLIEKEKANIIIAQAGQQILGDLSASLEVLHPFEDWRGKELKDSNMTSIVARLDYGQTSFLFTADVLAFQEREMILRGVNLDADILKVGHHGSKTSSSDEFIKTVSPETAVISAGKNNSYGHPRQETLDTLAKYGITVLRTDLDGDIKITSNGKTYAIVSDF